MSTGHETQDGWWIIGVSILALAYVFISNPRLEAGNFPGEQPSYAREVGTVANFFYKSGGNGDGQIEYICKCFPGTTGCGTTSSAVWQVSRFTYDSSNRISIITFAAGDDAYGSICDNRASLDYVD